jgi:hypothetical protein
VFVIIVNPALTRRRFNVEAPTRVFVDPMALAKIFWWRRDSYGPRATKVTPRLEKYRIVNGCWLVNGNWVVLLLAAV